MKVIIQTNKENGEGTFKEIDFGCCPFPRIGEQIFTRGWPEMEISEQSDKSDFIEVDSIDWVLFGEDKHVVLECSRV